MSWRNKISPSLKPHLERQINESHKQKKAYKNDSNAQLWCAIANLSKEVFDLKLRLTYLEKTIQTLIKNNKK